MQENTVSHQTLLGSTLLAFVLGAIALVTLILPAEYNIDPLGVGAKLGLTALAPDAQASADPEPAARTGFGGQVVEVIIPAGGGVEYKLQMQQGARLSYEWMTDGAMLYVDMHGEPQGDTTGYFESYTIATVAEMKGSFSAAFDGTHGWYWENSTDKPVAVQLVFDGMYEIVGEM